MAGTRFAMYDRQCCQLAGGFLLPAAARSSLEERDKEIGKGRLRGKERELELTVN